MPLTALQREIYRLIAGNRVVLRKLRDLRYGLTTIENQGQVSLGEKQARE